MDNKPWEQKLKEALILLEQSKIKALEKELENKEEFQFSKEFQDKMQTLIDSIDNKNNNIDKTKISYLNQRKLSIKKKALIIIAAIVLVMSMILTAEGNREAIAKMIIEIGRSMDRITFENEDGIVDLIREEYAPTYIPKGYTLLEENKGKMIFQNESGDEIIFSQISPKGSSTSVDNDDVIKKEVKIGSNQGIVVESLDGDWSIMYWDNGRYLFMLTAYFKDEEELIKIAESVKLKEK